MVLAVIVLVMLLLYQALFTYGLTECSYPVAKCKFMCPMHSEAKQTETSEFGARKVYCRAKHGEWVACAQKTQNPQWFSGRSFHRQHLG